MQVMEATLQATAGIKVAKVFPIGNNVCASIELFCASPEAFKAVFHRSLGALKSGVQHFLEQIRPQLSLNHGHFEQSPN